MKAFVTFLLLFATIQVATASDSSKSDKYGKVFLKSTLKSENRPIEFAEVVIYKNFAFECFKKTSFTGKLNYELEDNSNYLIIFRKKGYTDKIVCINTCSRTGNDASGTYTATLTMAKKDKNPTAMAQIETIDLMSNLDYSLILPSKDVYSLEVMFSIISAAFKADTFLTLE